MNAQLYIATNGLGVWYSDDLGENLIRMNSRMGMYSGNHIWALANDPSDPNILLVGTNGGLFRLDRAKKQWTHMPIADGRAVQDHGDCVLSAQSRRDSRRHAIRSDVPLGRSRPNLAPARSRHRRNLLQQERIAFHADRLRSRGSAPCLGGSRARQRLAEHRRRRHLAQDHQGDGYGRHSRPWPSATMGAGRRVFAATDRGFYVSVDDGESWEKGHGRFPVRLHARASFRAPISAASCSLPMAMVRRARGDA